MRLLKLIAFISVYLVINRFVISLNLSYTNKVLEISK